MKTIQRFVRRHSLLAGVLLMFALTWPVDLAHAGLLPFNVPFAVYLFLGWGFILAALFMTGFTQGRQAVEALLRRFLIWRVGWPWYLVAFLLYPSIFLAAVALNALWTKAPVDFSTTMASQFFGAPARLPLYILPFFLFEALANGEEMGWRGYVLPRLRTRHDALTASLILGLIWGFWHLPKYLGLESSGSFALGMVKVFGDAILYTWLTNNARGSLLLVTIFHAAGNTAAFFLPLTNALSGSNMGAQVIAAILVDVVAFLVVAVYGPAHLSWAGRPLKAAA
jgi:membrane protease YdiL (CAAX protease family)